MGIEDWSWFHYIALLVELLAKDTLHYVIVTHYGYFVVSFVVVS